MNEYDDIINLPRHVSKNRKQMSLHDRAAQFAPFSALTGYAESIKETSRVTSIKPLLSKESKDLLNAKLMFLKECSEEEINVTYFVKDKKKDGGKIEVYNGLLKRIDEYSKEIVFNSGKKILINDLMDIRSYKIDLVFSNFGI